MAERTEDTTTAEMLETILDGAKIPQHLVRPLKLALAQARDESKMIDELDGCTHAGHDLDELLTLIADMTPAAFEAFMSAARDAARRVKEVERNG